MKLNEHCVDGPFQCHEIREAETGGIIGDDLPWLAEIQFQARRRRNRIGSANELYCESRKRLVAEKLPHNLEFIADAATGKPAFLVSVS